MNFDDLDEGDELSPRVVENLRGDDMKLVAAILQDPYPPHFDERRAEELDYPGLLNQGPSNLSFLVQAVFPALESPTDVRGMDVRFDDMVFAGQTVEATATVADKRVEDGEGLVEFAVELEKPDGEVAVGGTITTRLPRD